MASKVDEKIYMDNLTIALSRIINKKSGVQYVLKDLYCSDEWSKIDELGIQRVLGEKFKALMESKNGEVKVCDMLGIIIHSNKTSNDNYTTQKYTRK